MTNFIFGYLQYLRNFIRRKIFDCGQEKRLSWAGLLRANSLIRPLFRTMSDVFALVVGGRSVPQLDIQLK